MPAIKLDVRGESSLRPRQSGHIQDKGMGGIFPGMSIDESDMHAAPEIFSHLFFFSKRELISSSS